MTVLRKPPSGGLCAVTRVPYPFHDDDAGETTGDTMGDDPKRTDRVIGVALGAAAGDALGAGYEFQDQPGPTIDMIGGGPFRVAPGEWTDDTAMADAILRVAASGTLDHEQVGAGFLEWFAGGPKDVGNQTRAVLASVTDASDLAAASAQRFAKQPRGSAGNGSLMRTWPVALAFLDDDAALAHHARAVSNLTHADPLAGDGCVLWCIAISRAVRDQHFDGIDDGVALLPIERQAQWKTWIDDARTKPPSSFKPNGYVVPALQAALAAVTRTPILEEQPCRHLRDALIAAVRIGDDTDTVAAIAGALLGARWGGTAVPLHWRALLHGWPGWDANTLARQAVLASKHGKSDDHGWPAAASVLPYYETWWQASPLVTPLTDDPDVLVGNVFALDAAATVDDVISLCRIGTADIAPGPRVHSLHLIDSDGDNANVEFLLQDLAETMAQRRDAGRRVLIHCVHAHSRTPSVAAAYLAQRLEISGKEALQRVTVDLPGGRPIKEFRAAIERLWPG